LRVTAAAASRHRSSASPLALAYAALVLYASLYPFTGWRWPPGQSLLDLARLPWPPWLDPFDIWSNLLGYLPLGLLATIAARRSGLGLAAALALGALAPSLLSYGCELLQQFVPTRHPSLKDWVANSAGASAGCLLALSLHALGLTDRWSGLRRRWFVSDSAGALALLALWPVGLLVPVPVPLGLGQVGDLVRGLLAEWLDGVPWAAALHAMFASAPARDQALSPLAEAAITVLGLLAPCLLAFTVVRPGWRRPATVVGALALAFGTMTLSTLLNFGPQHALSWIGRVTLPALAAGTALALLLAPWPRPVIAGCGLITLTGLVAGVAQAPVDPYFAHTLQLWEQGRFVRFHGLAQWVGWLWPYLAIGWLLLRLARRGPV
jgi:VanZ family protein